MKKFIMGGVSLIVILSANNAMAAGYTCEELIEYTSCNTGYYLNTGKCIESASCGAGSYLQGFCERPEWYAPNWAVVDSNYWTNLHTKEECVQMDGCVWIGQGCYDEADGAMGPLGYDCVSCEAGTYQPDAGQYSCSKCPAGSYCATAGLTAVTGLCSDGSYSLSGATACNSCPSTTLKDSENRDVVAITGGAGATSMSACHISPNTRFKDSKGIYRFRENCNFVFEQDSATNELKKIRCAEFGGVWNGPDERCETYRLPENSSDYEYCDFGLIDLDTGDLSCGMI